MTKTVAPPRVISAHTRLLLDAYARMTTAEKNPSGIWRRTKMVKYVASAGSSMLKAVTGFHPLRTPATTTMSSRNSTQRSLVGLVRLPLLSGHPETLQ